MRDFLVAPPTMTTVNYWLVKQEPDDYAWAAFVRDGHTAWTGVRNFQARNSLRVMKTGDLVLYYHSGEEKRIAGLARVVREAYPDPTATEGDWSCVDLVPVKALNRAVTLATIRAAKSLKAIALLRQPRLSVLPLSKAEFWALLELGDIELP